MPQFEINPAYTPVADQPQARDGLADGLTAGDRFQTLLGVTGSGKTATMAFTIEQVRSARAAERGHAGVESRDTRQLSQQEKAERAEYVVQNDGDLKELEDTLSELLDNIGL